MGGWRRGRPRVTRSAPSEDLVLDPRLRILFLTPFPVDPPTFGAQRRIQGLMAALARRHEVSAVSVVSPDVDLAATERAMRAYCRQVALVPGRDWKGVGKRWLQVRALASRHSFERRLFELPALRDALRRVLGAVRHDVVSVELPFLAHQDLAIAPPGEPPPLRVLDEHNIEFDLARQQAGRDLGLARRVHNGANWPKIQREETETFRTFDGVTFCSEDDLRRARELAPEVRGVVVPNAVDVDHFRPDPRWPAPDGRTIVFFGAINYFPNVDGLRHLFHDVWPRVAARHPDARLKIIGQHPTAEVLAFAGPRVEVTGRVDDLRPHLASAALTVAPLRIGGGTRFKILEAMAMGRPVVSTRLGAEGIAAEDGRQILLADEPAAFADAVGGLLAAPARAAELGAAGRRLVEERYSWAASASALERFLVELAGRRLEGALSPASVA